MCSTSLTMVCNPFLSGTPWYRLMFRKRWFSSLPRIRTTLFDTVLTTSGTCIHQDKEDCVLMSGHRKAFEPECLPLIPTRLG